MPSYLPSLLYSLEIEIRKLFVCVLNCRTLPNPNVYFVTNVIFVFDGRVFVEGGWDRAIDARKNTLCRGKPWVVLVTGLNGIRKTTAMQQPWFAELLFEALSPQLNAESSLADLTEEDMPTASNSFFRQLDHLVATVGNEEFRRLYKRVDVQEYAKLKDAIFGRYRTVAEICGMLLLKEACKLSINCLVETSGRDIAMFDYIDYCFPSETHNKLVIHFSINDVSFAEQSVKERMIGEMVAGKEAVSTGSTEKIIYANAGGPYGWEQLKDVLQASNQVMDRIFGVESGYDDWLKVRVGIEAFKDKAWIARSLGQNSKFFEFEKR